MSDGDLSKQVITLAKGTREREWLGEVSAVVLQQALADLNVAYRNFFASISGKRTGRQVAPLRFRSRKDNRQAIRFTVNARFTVLDNGRLRLPKIGDVEVRWSRELHVEDLCVAGLGRTRLARSVHDAGWSSFVGMLEYKAARYRRTFGKIDRFAPTSQTCSQCGRLDGPKPRNVRSWTCPCGAVHDRDVNAAINVLAQGRRDNSNDRGAHIRPALVPAARREAVIHPHAACSTRSAEGIPVL